MNAAQVNTLGGVCELLGVVAVVWGLLDVASYRGDLARMRAWLNARRVAVIAAARRLLRRPGRSVVLHAQAASAAASATGTVTVTMRGPFTPQPGQSLEDQIAELGALVNRLREGLITQEREHRAVGRLPALAPFRVSLPGSATGPSVALSQLRGRASRQPGGSLPTPAPRAGGPARSRARDCGQLLAAQPFSIGANTCSSGRSSGSPATMCSPALPEVVL